MNPIVEGVLIGGAIVFVGFVSAELALNYSVGDFLKDLAIHIFQGAKAKVLAQYDRASSRAKDASSKVQAFIQAEAAKARKVIP